MFFHGKQQIPWQTANSWCGVKIRLLWNTAGPDDNHFNNILVMLLINK